MENLTADEVLKYITENCPDIQEDTIEIIKKARVTGRRAAKWTLKDWSRMGISYGDVLDIISSITEYRDANRTVDKPQTVATTSKSPQPCSSKDVETERYDSEDEFLQIAVYFNEEDFKEMGAYEKRSYMAKKELYEEAVKNGVQLQMPNFMRLHHQTPVPPSEKRALSDTGSDNNAAAGSSSNRSCLFSKKRQGSTSKKSSKVKLTEAELEASLPKFDVNAILDTVEGRGIKAVRKKLLSDGIVYDKERKLLMRELTKWLHYKHVNQVKLVSMDMKEGLAVSLVTAYPKFKDGHPTRPSWWRILDREGPAGYIANCSINILRNTDPSDRLRGGGKNKRSGVSSDDENEEPSEEEETNRENRYNDKDAGWMNLTMPYAANKSSLVKGMQDSFPVRQRWIKEVSPTVSEVLQKYPHMMSFRGEMLVQEFELLYPQKGNLFARNFPLLIEKIADQLQEINDIEVNIQPDESRVLKACLFMAKSLPRPNLARFRRRQNNERTNETVMPLLDNLIQFIPVGSNIETLARERREGTRAPVQPYLMALVPDACVTKQFIVADSKLVELESSSILFALDILFKSYHVFNVEYPLGWKVFWEVVERGVVGSDQHKLSNAGKEFLSRYGFDLSLI